MYINHKKNFEKDLVQIYKDVGFRQIHSLYVHIHNC